MKITAEVEKIMEERFGRDTVIALATVEEDVPCVRYVNAFYEHGAFYIITYGLSNKMRQLEQNPQAAIAGDWFTARGLGSDLGYWGEPGNAEIVDKLRRAFSSWIDNGHNDFQDENTRILQIRLKSGVLFSNGTRYDIDFEG